jgi:cation diffusion facilitator CzcD-associated flavoprotein CzcO/acetyl esterase/lipase
MADVDVVVVGAGFAGMYLLHLLRGRGFSVQVIEAGDDVGGTWYWNRYPGARCDVQSFDYSFGFDPELDAEWTWTEKYAPQPEILRYAQHVATKYDLRRNITFSTRVESARWDDMSATWQLHTSTGATITSRFYVMASGCLSVPKEVDIAGTDRFGGEVYFTSRWPHQGVDFTGKRVAVIGTGSSAIQSIPIIATQASSLTVFQRTPNFSIPAYNGPVPDDKYSVMAAGRADYRAAARLSPAGVPVEPTDVGAMMVTDEERLAHYEAAWQRGGIIEFLGCYNDHLINEQSNEQLSEFVRSKIRGRVTDPAVAELLCPKSFPIGTKRLCVDTNYYETYNLPHVRLVDLHAQPITTITESGIDVAGTGARADAGGQADAIESMEFDAIVFATGFDAMTGALVNVDIAGRNGTTLKEAWADGPVTYLGLMVNGFPNFFTITGPGSPSVLANMMVAIEQHVEWVADCLAQMLSDGLNVIEPTPLAQAGWVQHTNDFASITLASRANSWYIGANVPGKPRVFLPYIGGIDRYRKACDEVVNNGYLGFTLSGPGGTRCNDGIVRRVQPDVSIMLELMGEMNLPPFESMSAVDARAFSDAMSAVRPVGPEVGGIVDGQYPGASGLLDYRLYRPASDGPHPIVVYFHGGGWVLGSATSDDPFCRDLCVRSDSIIISVDYAHAPEARFPAPVDDGFAAVQWAAANATSLGGLEGQLAVAGWSAGANIAAVVCQLARDAGAPRISGQLLLTPVTDSDMTRASYRDNGEGYILTKSLMEWFWNHYADEGDRHDPRAAPLRAASLANLPPAFIVTCEFDPLRDEGIAYGEALASAGVPVQQFGARGQIHTSLTAVDALATGVEARAAMGEALRSFFVVAASR